MPLSSIYLPNYSSDVVGVYDAEFKPVFRSARPLKAAVSDEDKVMEHPLETGATIIDHKIQLPITIEMPVHLTAASYRSTYQQIKQLKRNGAILTVQTKAATYPNMIISGIPHEEDPSRFDTIVMLLKFKEAKFENATFGALPPRKVAKRSNTSTVKRGQQTGVEPAAGSTKKTSILADLTDKLKK